MPSAARGTSWRPFEQYFSRGKRLHINDIDRESSPADRGECCAVPPFSLKRRLRNLRGLYISAERRLSLEQNDIVLSVQQPPQRNASHAATDNSYTASLAPNRVNAPLATQPPPPVRSTRLDDCSLFFGLPSPRWIAQYPTGNVH